MQKQYVVIEVPLDLLSLSLSLPPTPQHTQKFEDHVISTLGKQNRYDKHTRWSHTHPKGLEMTTQATTYPVVVESDVKNDSRL